ncbi:MAG: site-2 protease family protein [Candidatus Thorarchaeota archaeon]
MPLLNSPFIDFILNPWFLLSLIFWLIVLALVYLLRNKKGAAYLFFPLLAMFKTKRLNNFLRNISRKVPKFWRIFWTIGIFISFGIIIFAFYFFFTNFINLLINPKIEQAVVPLIPGVTINLPIFFYLILPLLFIVTTHEFAHGIAASADGLDIKSTGVIGAGIFYIIAFGAFVEVDERIVSSSKVNRYTRLRIAAAGTYINGITAGIALVLLLCFPLMIAPWYRQVTQVHTVLKEDEGGFNYENISSGDAIIAIKKSGTTDENYVYLDELKGVSLSSILNNKTALKCEINDSLTLKIYDPSSDAFSEKNITLGPRYYIGLRYEYTSDGLGLKINKVLSLSEGGNNFDNISAGLIVIKINGIPINVSNGDTLESVYTSSFQNDIILNNLNFSTDSANYTLDLRIDGVMIGIYSNSYFMYKNGIAKFFTSFWPEFLLRELSWLFLIAFSVTLFNMLPLPIFDGDRMVKELINWGIGENYKTLKKKKDKFYYNREDNDYELSEYRVEKIDSIEIIMKDQSRINESSKIKLSEDKYEIIDKIGDGFKDTVLLKLPEKTELTENAVIQISYEHYYDEKKKIKNLILNTLRFITIFIILGNFILSFIKFGGLIFWM